ncbi:uncharacterized protein STEHIDRAFT_142632 [Stereum hirsutum FP-91666 SS1]|uniref:uncharacterized protein n=1 Tax=Stereum hirsutum (strain FP-91666) TaxID=721885 RepID=UPI0004449690|nr:uncharacterized protein STEHIDRAFT_142632 [Stereum hirsutum FP-91666 SS1]EIM80719.1 hypothetical protein STEHIDRAFT_142632 [Stereum hirsutum FP-91666 SS1]
MPGGWASRAQSPERSELCSISENQSSSPSSSTSPNSSRPRSSRADGLGLDTSLVQVVDSDKPESSVKIEASPSAVTGPVHLEESPARKPQDVEEELPSRASSSSAESFDPDRAVYGMKQYTHPFFFTPLLPQPALRQDLQPGLGGWANHWNRLAQQPLATVPTPMDVEQPETGNSGAFTPSSVAPPHMHTSQERGLSPGVVEENAMEGVQKTPASSRPSLEVVEGNAMEGVQETPASSSLSLGVVEENAMEGIEKTQASSSLSENSSDERAAGILDELARMSITSGLSAQVDGDDSVEERMDIPTSQILPILEDKDADLDVQMAIPADLGGDIQSDMDVEMPGQTGDCIDLDQFHSQGEGMGVPWATPEHANSHDPVTDTFHSNAATAHMSEPEGQSAISSTADRTVVGIEDTQAASLDHSFDPVPSSDPVSSSDPVPSAATVSSPDAEMTPQTGFAEGNTIPVVDEKPEIRLIRPLPRRPVPKPAIGDGVQVGGAISSSTEDVPKDMPSNMPSHTNHDSATSAEEMEALPPAPSSEEITDPATAPEDPPLTTADLSDDLERDLSLSSSSSSSYSSLSSTSSERSPSPPNNVYDEDGPQSIAEGVAPSTGLRDVPGPSRTTTTFPSSVPSDLRSPFPASHVPCAPNRPSPMNPSTYPAGIQGSLAARGSILPTLPPQPAVRPAARGGPLILPHGSPVPPPPAMSSRTTSAPTTAGPSTAARYAQTHWLTPKNPNMYLSPTAPRYADPRVHIPRPEHVATTPPTYGPRSTFVQNNPSNPLNPRPPPERISKSNSLSGALG